MTRVVHDGLSLVAILGGACAPVVLTVNGKWVFLVDVQSFSHLCGNVRAVAPM
ncbi:hypothetical protein Jden_2372 [Jonesia denitrificans DSM 20603]|uniref:Uncharacterized protein n=1 Tax=Jonesia denitrificans (strain ATCC 14870 / DSM 20603 / BCRC 15368 / CIP 55.134 / JCM 11481 / NBRC 15587 / NCTC 10816 / Prevot 55134) TaxID=471856 RepID=C7R2L5_JONDD|nr:hypothetical protein Jden_2372 [Jonesia denitrificans DSM 20603]SQH22786.1 Uncharacterised protein [Jonesia denitrificans]